MAPSGMQPALSPHMTIDTTTRLDENKRIALAVIDRVFVHGEPDAIDELATEDFTPHTFGSMPPGREPLKQVLPRMAQGLRDAECRIDEVIAFRIRDGRVSEHWHAFDGAALMEQLKPKG